MNLTTHTFPGGNKEIKAHVISGELGGRLLNQNKY